MHNDISNIHGPAVLLYHNLLKFLYYRKISNQIVAVNFLVYVYHFSICHPLIQKNLSSSFYIISFVFVVVNYLLCYIISFVFVVVNYLLCYIISFVFVVVNYLLCYIISFVFVVVNYLLCYIISFVFVVVNYLLYC